MPWSASTWLDASIVMLALGIAAPFKPWQVLRHAPLQNPWLGAMVLLPTLWWTEHFLPTNVPLHVSGAALLVLMFGWPLAMWSLPWVALAATALTWRQLPDTLPWPALISHVAWSGVVPGTLSLCLGLLTRRWLPHHLFIFILGRGFIMTALAVALTGALALLAGHKPPTLEDGEWMLGYWLMGWGEAFSTGMLTSIFVAFKPHWLLTYSDQRYLPAKDDKR